MLVVPSSVQRIKVTLKFSVEGRLKAEDLKLREIRTNLEIQI